MLCSLLLVGCNCEVPAEGVEATPEICKALVDIERANLCGILVPTITGVALKMLGKEVGRKRLWGRFWRYRPREPLEVHLGIAGGAKRR